MQFFPIHSIIFGLRHIFNLFLESKSNHSLNFESSEL
jgi:hypothetical protein